MASTAAIFPFWAMIAAQTPTRTVPARPPSRIGISTSQWDFSWTTKPWRARSDASYVSFRQAVDALGRRADGSPAAAASLVDLARRERTSARRSPTSPLAQYRFAYAAYMALQISPEPGEWSRLGIDEVVDNFHRILFPGQPEYARAMFLNDSIPMPQTIRRKLGNRLYALDPDDRRVLQVLTHVTNPSLSPEERADAIRLADLLVSRWPDYAKGYAVRGSVYFTSFFADYKKKNDGLNAIRDFREYLTRVPANEPHRKDVEKCITFVQSQLKKP